MEWMKIDRNNESRQRLGRLGDISQGNVPEYRHCLRPCEEAVQVRSIFVGKKRKERYYKAVPACKGSLGVAWLQAKASSSKARLQAQASSSKVRSSTLTRGSQRVAGVSDKEGTGEAASPSILVKGVYQQGDKRAARGLADVSEKKGQVWLQACVAVRVMR
eukprot:1161060-Pelagomonas_calceolata.AAC.2